MLQQFLPVRSILSLLLVLLLWIPVQAQDTPAYELDAFPVGQSVTDSFEGDVTARFYGFYASAGDSVTISMTQAQGSDLDPLLILLDETGVLLAVDDDSGTTTLAAQIRNVEIPEDGAYLVLATSLTLLEGAALPDGDTLDFTLQISGATVPDAVLDVNTVTIAADELLAVVTDEISEEQPAHFFLLQAQAGDLATLEITGDEFFMLLMIFDPDGARIGADPSALSRLELEQDGTYLILVTDAFFYELGEDNSFFTGGSFELSGQ